jgi:uncharacterized integral membrane protein
MQRSIIVGLLVALVLTIFALQNDEIVTIRFFVGKVDGSLSLILLITIIVGVLLGVVFSIPSINKQAKMLQQRKKEIDRLQGLVDDYKKQVTKSGGQSSEEGEEQQDKKKRRW